MLIAYVRKCSHFLLLDNKILYNYKCRSVLDLFFLSRELCIPTNVLSSYGLQTVGCFQFDTGLDVVIL